MRTGEQYVEGLRDGRSVFLEGERVEDVTTHPAFRESVRSVARIYDVASDPANRDLMTFTSPASGQAINRSWMIPRSREDLVLRRRALRRIAEESFGLIGRGPEQIAGFLAGFASHAPFFDRGGSGFGDNVRRFYEFASENDAYVTNVIVPPQIDRSKPAHQQAEPHLYAGVKEERDDGLVIRGAQMLGTGTAIADWVLLSCIHPLGPGDENHAITVVVPVGAPGLRVYSRRMYGRSVDTFDYPLATRFDETDSWVVFDDVLVPWEHVFVDRNVELVREQWYRTPGHLLGNNQAQIRFAVKLLFLTGLMRRVAMLNGVENLPPVQGTVAEFAAHAAMIQGLVQAAEDNHRVDEYGVAWPGPDESFAAMTLASSLYPKLITLARELSGGGLIQLPSSIEDFENGVIAADFDRYLRGASTPARERIKILKLVWDFIGSEFASRHLHYEMFYAGQPFVVKQRMYRMYDFGPADALVDAALASYELDERVNELTADAV